MPRSKAPRRTPTQERSRDTYEVILSAAELVLTHEGLPGLTTKKVARKAGVGIGTFYQYFSNQEDLLLALQRRTWEGAVTALTNVLAQVDGQPLLQMVPAIVEALVPPLAERMRAHGWKNDNLHPAAKAERERVFTMAVDRLVHAFEPQREHLRPSDLRLAAAVIVRTVSHLAYVGQRDHEEALRSGAYAKEVAQLVTRYVLRDA